MRVSVEEFETIIRWGRRKSDVDGFYVAERNLMLRLESEYLLLVKEDSVYPRKASIEDRVEALEELTKSLESRINYLDKEAE